MKKTFFIAVLLFVFILSACSKKEESKTSEPQVKMKNIYLITYKEDQYYTNNHIKILKEFLAKNNFHENKDYYLKILSAQSDMSIIPMLVDKAKNDKPDLLITFHSAVLYAAINRAAELKKVFSIVANPFILGAGKSDTDHLANITGCYNDDPVLQLISFAKEAIPAIKKIGLIYMLGEEESEYLKNQVIAAAKKANIIIEAQPYTEQNGITEAVNSLLTKKIDVVIHMADLNSDISYQILSKKTFENKIPFLAYWNEENSNALIVCEDDDSSDFNEFANLSLRILQGADPTKIPFINTSSSNQFFINKKVAESMGIHISETALKKADKIIE